MLKYPLRLSFKLLALGARVQLTDMTGAVMAFAKGKAFALKENIRVFSDENEHRELFRINANRVVDFSASYSIVVPELGHLGAVRRQGMRSLWKASYEIVDASGTPIGKIHEENAWLKVIDGLVEAIPLAGPLLQYFINPAYIVELRGQPVLYVKKEAAVFEGKFTVEQRGGFADWEEALLLSSILMMVILERARG